MKREVTITYLEMLDPSWLRARPCPDPSLRIKECVLRQPDLHKFMYRSVGRNWFWRERLVWTDEQWAHHATSENVRMWMVYLESSIAGYFELKREDPDTIEIGYFGLMPECIGNGFGGYMLTEAIRLAWDWGARRVWVHTCTLDHSNALGNYLARGMKVFKTETVNGTHDD
jgi:GNAT superfamily N-acetyltransferase